MSQLRKLAYLCEHCLEEVVISYVCPKCQKRVCMLCAIENRWKCPNCNAQVV